MVTASGDALTAAGRPAKKATSAIRSAALGTWTGLLGTRGTGSNADQLKSKGGARGRITTWPTSRSSASACCIIEEERARSHGERQASLDADATTARGSNSDARDQRKEEVNVARRSSPRAGQRCVHEARAR